MITIDEVRARGTTLSVQETADVFRIGINQCYAGIRSGEIPSISIGRSIRVPVPALLQLLGAEPRADAGADPSPEPAPTTILELKDHLRDHDEPRTA